ncbi:MAG TPA: hypothetical protein IGS53_04900 [Leptolyngbyaceae cyanobacterium M33_DOE_097]|uniref:Uncharacterized protein n=1 Tax=Oscillatoriales cyanobacterium SpSt-418 TaxID=2282169 RepID=A0A7C3PMS2_9CYAN|nr:hypothetical protein [Leptolyngbyaceae cyanobacterium M33_DOE_097]
MQRRVVVKRVVSPDGRAIAMSYAEVISGDTHDVPPLTDVHSSVYPVTSSYSYSVASASGAATSNRVLVTEPT